MKKNGAKPRAAFPLRVAGIDVGSNAIRFIAAEFHSPERFTPIESERVPVRLGHSVFLTGRLTRQGTDGAVAALARFRARIQALGIRPYRAVATSAVREARNGDEFLRRVKREAGVQLEVISGSEEARLVHLAVRSRVDLGRGPYVLADLGGGSVEVSLVDESGILWSESHTMGAVRLLEELAQGGDEPGGFQRLLAEYASTLRIPRAAMNRSPAGLIATGGNIEALARLAGAAPGAGGVQTIALPDLRRVIGSLARLSFRERVEEMDLREDRADVVLPAAMVYERLAVLAGTERILVPCVGVKEGILLDLVEDLAAHDEHRDRRERETWSAATSLGRRYLFDEAHAAQVAKLALALFDQLRDLHELGEDDRRILLAASLLHDIGGFVSYRRHHKHTQYLVSQSELPGFAPSEIDLASQVARYHRKGEPSVTHEAYARLQPRARERVRSLSSLLRIADALDREHSQKVQGLRVRREGKAVVLDLQGPDDLLLEKWALERRAALFEKIFRLRLRVRNGSLAA